MCRHIQVDNAGYFRSELFKNYMKALNIEINFSSARRPNANGMIEVSNRTLKNSIVAMSKNTLEWDTRLDFFKLAYNSSIHRATGFSPSMIFFAREIRNPFSIHLPTNDICTQTYVKNRLQHIQEVKLQALLNQERIMKEYVDEEALKKVKTLKIGQTCYLKVAGNPGALQKKFEGPFEVIKRVRNNNYYLRDLTNSQRNPIKRHIDKLFSPTTVEYENCQRTNSDEAQSA